MFTYEYNGKRKWPIIMVALWNRVDHYIFYPVVCFFLLFFPRLISAVAMDIYHTSTHGVVLVRILV